MEDYSVLFAGGATDMIQGLTDVAPVAIGVGVAYLVVRRAWALFKGISR